MDPKKHDTSQKLEHTYMAVLHGMQKDIVFMVYWIWRQARPFEVGLSGRPTSKSHNPCIIITYCVEDPTWIGW